MDYFNSIPDYPDCPTYVTNSDNFEYTTIYNGKNQYGRFRAAFVSNQTGKHKFFVVTNNKARIYIDMNPNGRKKILDRQSITTNNWDSR